MPKSVSFLAAVLAIVTAGLLAVDSTGPFAPNAVYTFAEAADGMKVSLRQIKRWVYYANRLPYVQYPRGRRLRGSDLNAFVNSHLVHPGGE